MSTDSIYHDIIINDPKDVQQFVEALEASEYDRQRRAVLYNNVQLNDLDAIRELMARNKNLKLK